MTLGAVRYPYPSPSLYDRAQEAADRLVESSRPHQCAFRIGYFARIAGKKRKENPYSATRGWAYYWGLGWDTADAENETITFSTDLTAETTRRSE